MGKQEVEEGDIETPYNKIIDDQEESLNYSEDESPTSPHLPRENLQIESEGKTETLSYQFTLGTDFDPSLTTISDDSTVITAGGLHDVMGFIIICFVVLIGDMARGIFYPTLWTLNLNVLGGSEVTQGYAVAAFSFGRILASPWFGKLADMKKDYGPRFVLITSMSTLILGSSLYVLSVKLLEPICLIAAQLMMGIGGATLGVTRAYVADISPTRDRTIYISWLTAIQYAGFTVTPLLGSIICELMNDKEYVLPFIPLVVNEFTAPAYVLALSCLFAIAILCFFFDNHQIHEHHGKKKKFSELESFLEEEAFCFKLSLYEIILVGFGLLNVALKGSISVFETLGVKFAVSNFSLSEAMAGFIVSACGFIGVLLLLGMRQLSRCLDDVQMIIYGTIVMIIGILSLQNIDDMTYNPLWRYLLVIFFVYGVGYPIGHTAVIGLFSKVIGRRPQGELQGWFAAAGSIGRIAFPIISGYIEHYFNSNVLFDLLAGILILSVFGVAWKRNLLLRLSR